MIHSSRLLPNTKPSRQLGQKNPVQRSHSSHSRSPSKSTRTSARDPVIVPNHKASYDPSKTFKVVSPSAKQLASTSSLLKSKPLSSSHNSGPIPPVPASTTAQNHHGPQPSSQVDSVTVEPSRKPLLLQRIYRAPGYEWDRRGRERELRIRTLARKFFAIWLCRVYGRVSPTLARQHHNRRLLVQMLGEWYFIFQFC